MPQNVFAKSQKINTVFKSEKFLYPEFVPERLPFRESHIDQLVYCIKPLSSGQKAYNCIVQGGTGTGKTATVKYVLREFEEYSDRAKSLYFNCFEHNSRHSVLSTAANFLGSAVPRRGTATDEVYTGFLEFLKKSSFVPIIVLDEFDQLPKQESFKLLYDFLRTTEYGAKSVPLIIISNNPGLAAGLDSRVKSSMQPEQVGFDRYAPQQLKEILLQRAQYALQPGALQKDVIALVAAHAAKLGGDSRVAIECLLRAGRAAEKENSAQITIAHARSAFSQSPQRETRAKKALPFLDQDQKALVEIISSKNSIDSGSLYGEFKKKTGKDVVERLLRMKLSDLEKKNIIIARHASKGRGKTRIIELAVPRGEL